MDVRPSREHYDQRRKRGLCGQRAHAEILIIDDIVRAIVSECAEYR